MKWYDWKPYVPVAVRRTRALKKMEKLQKKGLNVQPVEIEGRKIARTFWGEAWCDHLESFSDYENRLPRGRTYVRNGSVCHLDISKGEINAMVGGSDLYKVKVSVKMLSRKRWKEVKDRCAGRIGSLIELLQGRLSENVMKVVTDRNQGLFPLPGEINLQCSCPDWAVMCKHVAAVLYGVGARLDEKPELLFLLRGVDHEELISAEAGMVVANIKAKGDRRRIEEDALADVFGIEMSEEETPAKPKPARGR
ncbi:MAG: SWIM zinc finger family protein, partial [Planctomycetota bacterium]